MNDLGIHKVIGGYWKAREQVKELKEELTEIKKGYKQMPVVSYERALNMIAQALGMEERK